jgi:hypothetical protein
MGRLCGNHSILLLIGEAPIGGDSEIAHFPGITFVLTASCEVEEGTQATRGKRERKEEVGSRGLTESN